MNGFPRTTAGTSENCAVAAGGRAGVPVKGRPAWILGAAVPSTRVAVVNDVLTVAADGSAVIPVVGPTTVDPAAAGAVVAVDTPVAAVAVLAVPVAALVPVFRAW